MKTSYGQRVVIPLLASVVPLLICLAIAEIGLRISGFRSPILRNEMFVWSETDPLLPFALRPGYRGSYATAEVTVGPDGNRTVSGSPPPGQDEVANEIIALGDSVVFGQGLSDDQTIPAQLQRVLAQGDPSIRTVSIAAPGYTSWNEYAALAKYPRLRVVKAVVLLYVSNDITFDNDHFRFRETSGRIHYMETTVFHKITRFIYEHSRFAYLLVDAAKRANHALRRRGRTMAGTVDEGALAYSVEAARSIADLCADYGIRFLVAIYRDGLYYRAPDTALAYERKVAEALRSHGIRHFVLTRATQKLSLRQFAASWNDEGHPSPLASRLIAEEIADELARRKPQTKAATSPQHGDP